MLKKRPLSQILVILFRKRDTSYDHYSKSTKSGILFSALFRSAEVTLRNEGRVGKISLNTFTYIS